jgi:hypothetical protein
MRDLQSAEPQPDRHERQVALVGALGDLDGLATPSKEVVVIPAELMTALVQQLGRSTNPVNANKKEDPTVKLRESHASSRLQATKDFRQSRTLPFTGLGVVIAGVWAAREPLGITDLAIDPVVYFGGAVAVITFSAMSWVLIRINQRVDEHKLDELYEPEVQEAALMRLMEIREYEFSARQFQQVLAMEVGVDRRRAGRIGSTVDLTQGLRDAAVLGLDRLVEACIIRRVQRGVMTVYEVPEENRT